MKSLMRNMAFLAVMALYIVSTMGYGVHRCTTDGTASLILLFGESPCEFVHSHIDSEGNSYTHSHTPIEHEDCSGHGECGHNHHGEGEGHNGCCSTDVYVITEDQTSTDDNFDLAPQITLLAASIWDAMEFSYPSFSTLCNVAYCPYAVSSTEAQQAELCTFII